MTPRAKALLKSIPILVVACCRRPGAAADADAYPDRTIKIIAGFPAGGAPDTTARLIGEKLQEAWGKPVVVENVTGAGGNLAADRVAKSAPDGYTLLMAGNASIVVNLNLYEKLPYDPVKDWLPVSQVSMTPNILAVHPDVAAKSVAELVALARAQPDGLTYAHGGIGISQHLAGELFKHMAASPSGRSAIRGAVSAMPDLVAGHVNLCFCNITNVLPLARRGQAARAGRHVAASVHRGAGVADHARVRLPGFRRHSLVRPDGASRNASRRSRTSCIARRSRRSPQPTARQIRCHGHGGDRRSPAEFAAVIDTEIPYWEKVIKAIGLKLK